LVWILSRCARQEGDAPSEPDGAARHLEQPFARIGAGRYPENDDELRVPNFIIYVPRKPDPARTPRDSM
jgi:hypothetical protein